MNDEPTIFAEDVRRITFKPGDVAVLTSRSRMSPDHVQNIKAQWNQIFPDVKCVVLEDLELSIANKERNAWQS